MYEHFIATSDCLLLNYDNDKSRLSIQNSTYIRRCTVSFGGLSRGTNIIVGRRFCLQHTNQCLMKRIKIVACLERKVSSGSLNRNYYDISTQCSLKICQTITVKQKLSEKKKWGKYFLNNKGTNPDSLILVNKRE